MDTTDPLSDTTAWDTTAWDTAVWWGCADCERDVELTAADVAGFLPTCPDCSEPLQELWRWELRAA